MLVSICTHLCQPLSNGLYIGVVYLVYELGHGLYIGVYLVYGLGQRL